MRGAMHNILYTVVNSNAMNGLSENDKLEVITPWWKTALTALNVVIALAFAGSVIKLVLSIRKKKSA